MSGRIFLVIFFFWALLAIVTPTLILLSGSSKPYLDSNYENSGVLKLRRMMENLEKQARIEEIALAPLQAPTPAPVSVSEPESDPEPVSGIGEAILKRFLKRR